MYLDGELIGRVDSFDGFPRYLWLREGSYRLSIFMEGYETLGTERPRASRRGDQDRRRSGAGRLRPAAAAGAGSGRRADDASGRVLAGREPRPADRGGSAAPAGRRLTLEVRPADAVVYLDGRLLGSGDQLASLHSPLIIDPGAHRLEVTRPGHASQVRSFEAARGEDVALRIELRPELTASGESSRVRLRLGHRQVAMLA